MKNMKNDTTQNLSFVHDLTEDTIETWLHNELGMVTKNNLYKFGNTKTLLKLTLIHVSHTTKFRSFL